MTVTTWPCPGCHNREPIPDPPVGIIECTKCEKHAYDLDRAGVDNITEEPLPCDPPNEPVILAGDCSGCSPEESREFQRRFAELDAIDREFRLSKLGNLETG